MVRVFKYRTYWAWGTGKVWKYEIWTIDYKDKEIRREIKDRLKNELYYNDKYRGCRIVKLNIKSKEARGKISDELASLTLQIKALQRAFD